MYVRPNSHVYKLNGAICPKIGSLPPKSGGLVCMVQACIASRSGKVVQYGEILILPNMMPGSVTGEGVRTCICCSTDISFTQKLQPASPGVVKFHHKPCHLCTI